MIIIPEDVPDEEEPVVSETAIKAPEVKLNVSYHYSNLNWLYILFK